MNELVWNGCYDESWKDFITPESFAHPAKMAHGLLRRIIEHGFERGYWQAGDLIGDPFGGIGSTGLLCSYNGLRSVSVELEPRFVAFAQENFALHRAAWGKLGLPLPVLVQGDSRRFAEIVGQVQGAVTSPPFEQSIAVAKRVGDDEVVEVRTYPVDVQIIASYLRERRLKKGFSHKDVCERGGFFAQVNHGGSSSNWEACLNLPTADQWKKLKEILDLDDRFDREMLTVSMKPKCQLIETGHHNSQEYGQSSGQIGNATGETYWQSMRAVYEQVRLALKPGGVAAVVVKGYVKKGKYVDLPGDTLTLLVALGFEPLERVRAMLVKESVENTLFEGQVTRKKERKSFFRRLAEKNGSPRIDFEEVLFVEKSA